MTTLAEPARLLRGFAVDFLTAHNPAAGILGRIARAADLADDDYNRVCAVNQHAVFYGMKAVIPSMLRAGGGSIVNISSISGLIDNYGTPSAAYVASKFAIRGMTKAAAMEYGAQNIRVNSVHPGFIETPMLIEATNEAERAGSPSPRKCRT